VGILGFAEFAKHGRHPHGIVADNEDSGKKARLPTATEQFRSFFPETFSKTSWAKRGRAVLLAASGRFSFKGLPGILLEKGYSLP
jgi:hypothetical protein